MCATEKTGLRSLRCFRCLSPTKYFIRLPRFSGILVTYRREEAVTENEFVRSIIIILVSITDNVQGCKTDSINIDVSSYICWSLTRMWCNAVGSVI